MVVKGGFDCEVGVIGGLLIRKLDGLFRGVYIYLRFFNVWKWR